MEQAVRAGSTRPAHFSNRLGSRKREAPQLLARQECVRVELFRWEMAARYGDHEA